VSPAESVIRGGMINGSPDECARLALAGRIASQIQSVTECSTASALIVSHRWVRQLETLTWDFWADENTGLDYEKAGNTFDASFARWSGSASKSAMNNIRRLPPFAKTVHVEADIPISHRDVCGRVSHPRITVGTVRTMQKASTFERKILNWVIPRPDTLICDHCGGYLWIWTADGSHVCDGCRRVASAQSKTFGPLDASKPTVRFFYGRPKLRRTRRSLAPSATRKRTWSRCARRRG
jgi:hypothetical protein